MDEERLITIGELARRSGQPVRKIRFWSDAGVLPPAGRTGAGHRLFDEASLVRVDLVATLRRLGLGLDTVRRVLQEPGSIAEVARIHARALGAEIQSLKLRRAVLLAIANRGLDLKETADMNDLAFLTGDERRHLVDEFVADTFGESGDPSGLGEQMRMVTHALPDDPSPEQVDAWVEVARLLQDNSFRDLVREMAQAGAGSHRTVDRQAGKELAAQVAELAGPAAASGVDPASGEARSILDRLLGESNRREVAELLAKFGDPRVDRYWALVGVINGWPPFPSPYPAFEWVQQALAANAR